MSSHSLETGIKRASDIVIATAAMLALSPLLMVLALTIRLRLGSPILFRQMRPGRNGVPFVMIKFRSMKESRDQDGNMLPDHLRISSIGRLLRASSLDELPELWNVIRGDMSLVGPRPLLMQYLPLYTQEQARRHLVRPGITGWAQINGRNAISWDEKFILDTWYVDNRSMLLDAKILALTAVKVLRRDDISATGEATMPVFTGSANNSPEA